LISASYFAGIPSSIPAQAQVQTPKLAAAVFPLKLPADRRAYEAIYVGITSSTGEPLAAPSDVTVFLSSSNLTVGTVGQSVTIRRGSTFALDSFTTTVWAGNTGVTASSNGFSSATVAVSTVSPSRSPVKLALFALPPFLIPGVDSNGRMVVQLQDADGIPAQTGQSAGVTLTSSNPGVMAVQQRVSLSPGSTFAFALVNATGANGASMITAQAPGLTSASAVYSTRFLPMAMVLGVAPTTPLALTNLNLSVTVSSGPFPVSGATMAWSSNVRTLVFQDDTTTTDAKGSAFATAYLGDAGNLTIFATATKPGYAGSSASVKVEAKPQPLSITLIPVNTILNATEPTDIRVTVSSRGKPLASVTINWSSDLGVVTPPVSRTDSSGSAIVMFVSPTNGTANVEASVSAPGYSSTKQATKITVNVFAPAQPGGGGGSGGILGLLFGSLTYIVVALVLLVILFVFVRRRRKGRKERSETEKGEGAEPEAEEEN